MVGRDALEHAALERRPEQLLVVPLAQGRRAHVAGALEVRSLEVLDRVGQVLEAGFARHPYAALLPGGDLVGGEPGRSRER